ncbi:hypothetical protein ACSBR2_024700 [Camellia fascicularis]
MHRRSWQNKDRSNSVSKTFLLRQKVSMPKTSLAKGKLNDGREIAVKKPLLISDKGKELVLKEMKLLLRSAHFRNIVEFLGFCSHREEMMLVFEFARNGSLDYLLFNLETGRSDALEWKQTYDIIVGVAQGLLYLHERSHSANELYKEGRVSEFMDRKLIPLVVLDQVQLCVHIRIMCTEYDPELRPTMGRVYSMLVENHSSSSTLVEESMRDGSSSASSTTQNSGPTELTNNGSSSGADIHLENEGLPKHRRLTRA